MISIVIPAHNEAAVIGNTLRTMLDGAHPGEMEIIVACNGCTDDTASIARRFGAMVRVVETKVASKIAALNLGDESATGFPRFYVDADIKLPINSIRAVADVLRDGPAMAAAPRMEVNLAQGNWIVRAFYTTWLRLPYHRTGMIGSGVYALSEAGRRRFDRFPEIIADDGFVHALFRPNERVMLESVSFAITPPSNLCNLIKVKTRSRLGGYQLRKVFPHVAEQETKDWGPSIWGLMRNPFSWPSLAIYVLVNLITRVRAKHQLRTVQTYRWERDESSRQFKSAELEISNELH